ncbi:TPA: hypothetical protein U5E09_002168 [Yersinia enterocolitica]|nr:hypothetical protein [Yersinia enterocolitica]
MLNNIVEFVDRDMVGKLVPAILSFFGAWFGTWWGLTKFKKEKHWEAKISAYEKIILAVENIAHWGEVSYRNAHCDNFLGDHITDDESDCNSQVRNISKLKSIGYIYFSKSFYAEVDGFLREVRIADSQHADGMLGEEHTIYTSANFAAEIGRIASRYLGVLVGIAEKDIGFSKKNRWWKRGLR